jgi:hypothetical protein
MRYLSVQDVVDVGSPVASIHAIGHCLGKFVELKVVVPARHHTSTKFK